jgi:hypothetical protein
MFLPIPVKIYDSTKGMEVEKQLERRNTDRESKQFEMN